jgi:hypothetical protein
MSYDDNQAREERRGTSFRDYIPLFVIVLFTALAGLAKQWQYPFAWDTRFWMHDWMGLFLLVFAMFKFFDLPGFADGFQMYDLLAKPFRPYAYLYPFLELALGLGLLSHWEPVVVHAATAALLGFGAIGVVSALRKGLDVNCACMGTTLSVPLSTVALTEDLAMATLAAAMLAVEVA